GQGGGPPRPKARPDPGAHRGGGPRRPGVGPAVGGWLVGLPFTSAPIALFLALGQGPAFAAAAAVGTMAGATSQAVFCLGYAWIALRRGPAASVAAGGAAVALSTAALRRVALPPPPLFRLVVARLPVAPGPMPPGGA